MSTASCTADVDVTALRARLQGRLDQKTKPIGALGRIEALALQVGLILRSEQPVLTQPQMVVFAEITGWRRTACRPTPRT